MPVYEYRCTSCGEELEVTQSFSDDPLTECPSCQGVLKKKFGVPGITFKGSGFYKTDSRGSSSSSSSSSGSGSSTSGSSSSGDSSSSDTSASKSSESSSSSSSKEPAATT